MQIWRQWLGRSREPACGLVVANVNAFDGEATVHAQVVDIGSPYATIRLVTLGIV